MFGGTRPVISQNWRLRVKWRLESHVLFVWLSRGAAETDDCVRPGGRTARRAPVGARPALSVSRDGQLRRRPGVEDQRLRGTQAAGGRRTRPVALLSAVLHVAVRLQNVRARLPQRRRRRTQHAPVVVLRHHAGSPAIRVIKVTQGNVTDNN